MKKIMRRVVPFITFDLPLQYEYIEHLFIKVHQREVQHYFNWSSTASIKKLIFHYWYYYVLFHFSFLFGAASLFSFLTTAFRIDAQALPLFIYLIIGCITFFILLLTHYIPVFYSAFLPKLETIAFNYEGKQLAQLEKCKQAQYSNLALVLIFYVWNKMGDLNALNSSDGLSKLLTKVYSVDNGSLKKNLELILCKNVPLSLRKLKEVEKGFEEAYSFLESLGYEKGINLLRALERKIKSR